jgi:hypothetical protein
MYFSSFKGKISLFIFISLAILVIVASAQSFAGYAKPKVVSNIICVGQTNGLGNKKYEVLTHNTQSIVKYSPSSMDIVKITQTGPNQMYSIQVNANVPKGELGIITSIKRLTKPAFCDPTSGLKLESPYKQPLTRSWEMGR